MKGEKYMKIIMSIFFVFIFGLFFMRSLFKLSKALNGNHKIGDGVCIKFMVIACMSAIATIANIIYIVQQIVSFVGSLI